MYGFKGMIAGLLAGAMVVTSMPACALAAADTAQKIPIEFEDRSELSDHGDIALTVEADLTDSYPADTGSGSDGYFVSTVDDTVGYDPDDTGAAQDEIRVSATYDITDNETIGAVPDSDEYQLASADYANDAALAADINDKTDTASDINESDDVDEQGEMDGPEDTDGQVLEVRDGYLNIPSTEELFEGYVETLIYEETGDENSLQGYELQEEVIENSENNQSGESDCTDALMADMADAEIPYLGSSRYETADLTDVWRNVYSGISEEVSKIAAGERASTVISIPMSKLGLTEVKMTKAQLQEADIEDFTVKNDDGDITGFTDEAKNAVSQKVCDQVGLVPWKGASSDITAEYKANRFMILYSLLADNPYELYWFDKVTGWTMVQNLTYTGDAAGTYIKVNFEKSNLVVRMPVVDDFVDEAEAALPAADSEYRFNLTNSAGVVTKTTTCKIDTEKAGLALAALEKAKSIAAEAEESCVTDYDKLLFFKNRIQTLAPVYNSSAAGGGAPYGNPWQLIYVFDENPDTKVVCEGYSKAFKLLCDLSDFYFEDFDCYLISGWLSSSSAVDADGSGHMWNIVRMDDGYNYLIDITNSRNGAMHLFLKGYISTNGKWRGFRYGTSGVINYSYKEGATAVFTEEELSLSETDYSGGVHLAVIDPTSKTRYTGYPVNPEFFVCNSMTGELFNIEDMTFSYSSEHILPGEVVSVYVNRISDGLKSNSVTYKILPGTCYSVELLENEYRYQGKAITPEVRVVSDTTGELLTEGVDYLVSYQNNNNLGTGKVIVSGIGLYTSSRIEEFEIIASSENMRVELPEGTFVYSGEPVEPKVVITNKENGEKLIENRDYTLKYTDNINVGIGHILVTGIGLYTSSETLKFAISPISIDDSSVYSDSEISIAYNKGKRLKPIPVVSRSGITLVKGTDYTVKYLYYDPKQETADEDGFVSSDYVTEIGDFIIRLTGKGNYDSGSSRDIKLKIVDGIDLISMSSSKITVEMPKYSYRYEENRDGTPKAIIPDSVVVRYNNEILSPYTEEGETHNDFDYTVSYSHNASVGTGYLIVTGNEKNGFSGSRSVAFDITGTSITKARVTGLNKLSAEATEYTGNPITLSSVMGSQVQVTVNGEALKEYDSVTGIGDYRLDYLNNENVGTATVIFIGMNGYTGTLKKTFKITPKDISKLDKTIALSSTAEDDTAKYPVARYQKSGAKPSVTVWDSDIVVSDSDPKWETQVLREAVDYTLSFAGNKKIVTSGGPVAKVTIKGKGNYSGKVIKYFYVEQAALEDDVSVYAPDLAVSPNNKGVYKANNYKSSLTITGADGKKLGIGSDVTVKYYRNYLNDTDGDDEITVIDDSDGIQEEIEPGETEETEETVKSITDYPELTKADSVQPGDTVTVLVTANGRKNEKDTRVYYYTGSIMFTYRILDAPNDIAKGSVFKIADQQYTGTAITIDGADILTAKASKNAVESLKFGTVNDDGTVAEDVDFVILNYANNIKKGNAKVTLRGVNKYSGTRVVSFKIVTRKFLWWEG